MLFREYLHPDFLDVVDNIYAQGFKLAVVGGTVRDYLLANSNKHDYDCELRPLENKNEKDLLESFKALSFGPKWEREELPFNVTRLSNGHFTVELSLARMEQYSAEFSHSNFKVVHSQKIDHRQGVLRRDFTINSMMYEFDKSWSFIDPLDGKNDLENKVLRACSSDFQKDPVRYLRAIRFHILLDFELPKEITSKAQNLRREDFNPQYLRYEATKSGRPLVYFFKFLSSVKFK